MLKFLLTNIFLTYGLWTEKFKKLIATYPMLT